MKEIVMKNGKYKSIHIGLSILVLLVFSSCSSTKEVTLQEKWHSSLNWDNYSSAEVTETDHLVIQSEDDIVIIDGKSGATVLREVTEDKGIFGQFVEEAKSSVSLKGEVPVKYYHAELPSTNHMLLFDNSEYMGEIRAINLETGDEAWTSNDYKWTLDLYQDAAGVAIKSMMQNLKLGAAGGTAVASSVLLQTRMIDAMIADIPGRDEFLFRTLDKLYLVDSKTGNKIWSNEEVNSTGIAAVTYLAESDQLLIAGSSYGLKEVIENASDDKGMKQVALLDAQTGESQWISEFKGRSQQIDRFEIAENGVNLFFHGGSVEVFDIENGSRILGTRDNYFMGATKVSNFLSGNHNKEGVSEGNMMASSLTAEPVFEGKAVYAVNPSSSSGIPNKKITKFDTQTGNVIWESTELKNTPYVKDIYLLDDIVIATIASVNPGRIVGKPIDAGIYAFSKKDGKKVWDLIEPFAEHKNHIGNVIYKGEKAWTSSGKNLYQIDLRTKEIVKKQAMKDTLDVGSAVEVKEWKEDQYLALGGDGFLVFDKDTMDPVFVEQVKGNLSGYQLYDNRLFYLNSKLLSEKVNMGIYNLGQQTKVSEFTLKPIPGVMYGRFCDKAYHLPQRMDQVILSKSGGMTSYNVW